MCTENDVPGASLNGRDPSQLKVLELKRWPQCRAGSPRGLKANLIARQDACSTCSTQAAAFTVSFINFQSTSLYPQ